MSGLVSRAIDRMRRRGVVDTLRYSAHWLSEHGHERRLGIDTMGSVNKHRLGIEHPDPEWCNYEPISYASIRRALRVLEIRPGHDVFVDYGCGKGRAVIMAATYPFKRVIGVEVSARLLHLARANLERARRKLSCHDIELVEADARTYRTPTDVTVAFLYNPFGGEVLAAVINNLRASLEASPRPLTVIYKYPQWRENLFAHCGWLRAVRTLIDYTQAGERLVIYKTT